MAHTIVMLQPKGHDTRVYHDYESVEEAMEGICSFFEQYVKDQMDSGATSIKYNLTQLFDYIDEMTDLACLVYQRSTESYAPKAKDWIKEKLYVLFREQDSHTIPSNLL